MKKSSNYPTLAMFGIFVMLMMISLMPLAGITIARASLASDAGGTRDVMVISGLPDFQALAYGQNLLSLAAVPVSQQGGRMTFQVTGLAASSPGTAPAVVYTLSEPMQGIIDTSHNTLQVDLANFNTAASEPEHIEKSRVSHALKTTANTMIIEITMDYKSLQGSEAIFSVKSIGLILPDGQTKTYDLEIPGRLIIDGDARRLNMGSLPQLAGTLDGVYSKA